MSSVVIGNRGGIPIIQTTAVVGSADVRFSLPNHIFRFSGTKGKVIVELTSVVPTGTTSTFPILIEVNGQTLPLNNTAGTALTFADTGAVLYYEILFDKVANTFVLTSSLV